MKTKQQAMESFQQIPGVGNKIAEDFWNIGLRQTEYLKGADPQYLYGKLCKYQHTKVDICMLYVLRCAIYYASEENPDPQLLKWWLWKDRIL